MEQYNREQESYREKNKESIKKQLRYGKLLGRGQLYKTYNFN